MYWGTGDNIRDHAALPEEVGSAQAGSHGTRQACSSPPSVTCCVAIQLLNVSEPQLPVGKAVVTAFLQRKVGKVSRGGLGKGPGGVAGTGGCGVGIQAPGLMQTLPFPPP